MEECFEDSTGDRTEDSIEDCIVDCMENCTENCSEVCTEVCSENCTENGNEGCTEDEESTVDDTFSKCFLRNSGRVLWLECFFAIWNVQWYFWLLYQVLGIWYLVTTLVKYRNRENDLQSILLIWKNG